MTIQLSTIAPDFDSLRIQLEQAADKFPSWKDRITSATGQTIVEMVAAIGAYSQYSIESAYQETWPDSAKNKEALYAASNYAGVRVKRKGPASVTFAMTSPGPITIPPFTPFIGAGTHWFNRNALYIGQNPTIVTLHQGEVKTVQVYGIGTDFQAFVAQEPGFIISDTDVLMTIDGVSIPVRVEGLWTLPSLPGVQQFTLPDGKMIILFGNDYYGSKPGTNNLVQITYVLTLGVDGNNVVTIGKSITLDGDSNIKGTPSTNPQGGGSEADYHIYKNVTPALFGAFDSTVTASQYKKFPLTYPGVIDARVLAQREINPMALPWMNTMKVCLLTEGPTWDNNQWLAFKEYFERNCMYSTRIVREDPVPFNVSVVARISCKSFANLSSVQANAEAALTALFAPRQGIIGLDLYISDILSTLYKADSNIEFVQMTSPPVDLVLSGLSVGYPTLTISTGGNLAPGTYDYGIGLISTLGGTAAPARWSSIKVNNPGSQITVTWPLAANPQTYQVFGRVTGPNLGLIANVAANGQSFQSFVDNGTITPTGTVPSQSTIASYYPHLLSKSLTLVYTTRNLRS
jgi:hypothetical protein